MRLNHRWCPKDCCEEQNRFGVGRAKRVRMIVECAPEIVERKRHPRYDLLLNWKCPACGHTEPVSSSDIRQSSARTKYGMGPSKTRDIYFVKEEKGDLF